MTTNKYIIYPKVYNMSLDERMNYNKKCAFYGKQVYDEMLKYGLVSLDTLEKRMIAGKVYAILTRSHFAADRKEFSQKTYLRLSSVENRTDIAYFGHKMATLFVKYLILSEGKNVRSVMRWDS